MMIKDVYKKHPTICVGTLLDIDGDKYVLVVDSSHRQMTRVRCVNLNRGTHFGSTLVEDINDITRDEAKCILDWDNKYDRAKVVGGFYEN
jgi:hypothetical protein